MALCIVRKGSEASRFNLQKFKIKLIIIKQTNLRVTPALAAVERQGLIREAAKTFFLIAGPLKGGGGSLAGGEGPAIKDFLKVRRPLRSRGVDKALFNGPAQHPHPPNTKQKTPFSSKENN